MKVKFINKYFKPKDPQRFIEFSCKNKRDAETIISALSTFYSGDNYSCEIGGKKAPLYLDWGLK